MDAARKDELYFAFSSHDEHLDGHVFVGVASTGIYCRPVCSARMPKYENCAFFYSAAKAEAAGYRPCLKCRPECAPGIDFRHPFEMPYNDAAPLGAAQDKAECAALCSFASGDAVSGDDASGDDALGDDASGSNASSFEESAQAQTCFTPRLLLAKLLLTDTVLPEDEIAHAAGFSDAHALEFCMKKHYRLLPSDMRKRAPRPAPAGAVTLRLGYRAPYNFSELLAFYRLRVLEGVEVVDDVSYARTVRMRAPATETDEGHNLSVEDAWLTGWIRVCDEPAHNNILLTVSTSLLPVLSHVIVRVRRQFDLDADPFVIHETLQSLEKTVPGTHTLGTRLPGAFDPFETACRAVLGQQVTVVAANKIAARIVSKYGTPITTGVEGLTSAFPTPQAILALPDIEEALGLQGVIKTRSRTILAIAQALQRGTLSFDNQARDTAADCIQHLQTIKGIGPWTANYIAMRCLSFPDAFLESDVGVKHALPHCTPKEALALAESWRPWRSYANICLWNSLA